MQLFCRISENGAVITLFLFNRPRRYACAYRCGDPKLIKLNNFNVFRQMFFSDDGCPSPRGVSTGQTPESFTLNQNFLANGRQLDFILLCDYCHKLGYILPSQATTRRFLAVARTHRRAGRTPRGNHSGPPDPLHPGCAAAPVRSGRRKRHPDFFLRVTTLKFSRLRDLFLKSCREPKPKFQPKAG